MPSWLISEEVHIAGSAPNERHRHLLVRVVDSPFGESVEYVSVASRARVAKRGWCSLGGGGEIDTFVHLACGTVSFI